MLCVVDCSNGAVCAYIQDLLRTLNGQFVTLFDQPDGAFPNHSPNPLEEESRAALKDKLIDTGADLGVCFDGDADRAIFLDERGSFVSPDLITALIGLYIIKHSGTVNTLDGVRIDFPDWWFIIRMSNAEPGLRLVVEVNEEELLESKTDEIISRIKEISRDVETL